ncbi:class I SAM-dependent methyltransferase [Algoriphagus limi]|uniref:Class I SAM-dependent methyltransferase n=1 Tax=Algoriphagus limi TaxID=2975273 RepID=A0ABT2G1N7_9BACT|nr:class I SAM-dependent methyltransferase [Algoriphagus limi]MCS5489184.1 class I SAM-dependent methyltransferase [Algoriphagus limi]
MKTSDKKYDEKYYNSVYKTHLNKSGYSLKLSSFWMYNIFTYYGFDLKDKKILDFGCGPGHLTDSINADCFDVSEYAKQKLKDKGRFFFELRSEIPQNYYDYILSSHSLEHSIEPNIELKRLYESLKDNGYLFLCLPIESSPGQKVFHQDIHKHMYCWNFQTITNLLIESDFSIVIQDIIHGPTGLKYLNNFKMIRSLGRIKSHFPSIFVVAQKNNVK